MRKPIISKKRIKIIKINFKLKILKRKCNKCSRTKKEYIQKKTKNYKLKFKKKSKNISNY